MTQVIEFLLSKWGSKFKPQYHQKKKNQVKGHEIQNKKVREKGAGVEGRVF
jgi:hypothetical protein